MRLILGLLLAFVAANTAAKWTYESRRDEMRDTLTESYQSTSLNKLNFKFPYNGGSTGTLVVRRMNNEIDVIVVVDKGQVLCSRFECSITVKFDDSKPMNIGGNPPKSGRHDTVFLHNAQSLIERMKKSKIMLIELSYYQAGREVFKFDIENLIWPPHRLATPAKK